MTWTKKITTVYHQQDLDASYCGAATAQMILDSIGAGLLDQNVLYNSNHGHNTESSWYTDPTGLTYTLNYYKPGPPIFENYFVTYTTDTELEGSQKIVHTLWRYGIAAGVLVNTGAHWIVVHGVSTDVEPSPGSSYSINGFWIKDPAPGLDQIRPALKSPPPHSSTDGCGGGGNRGKGTEYVVYNTTWKDTIFTTTNYKGSVWYNHFHSVCDPSKPQLGELVIKGDQFLSAGDRFIEAEEATSFALRGSDEHNLLEDETFAQAMEGAKPTTPVLVQRLDLNDTFYYLVPLAKDDEVTSLLSVDGLYGNFRGGIVLSKPIRKPFIDRDEAFKRIVNQTIDLGEQLGRIMIREGAFCFYPLMVWRPCRESRSPYYPFFMITIGTRNIFVGFDGTIYPGLHQGLPGS
jgi:hypothetical protein